jgi:capsular polysaccharide biosynthesis protein
MDQTHDPTLGDLLELLKRGLLVALLTGAALAAAVYFLSVRQSPVYETSAVVLTTQFDPGVRGLDVSLATAPRIDASAYQAATYSAAVQERARSFFSSPEFIGAAGLAVSVQQTQLSSLIRLTARSTEPRAAQETANATAQALIVWDEARATRVIERTISRLESQLQALDQQIVTLGTNDAPSAQAQREGLLAIRTQRLTELSLAQTLRNSAAGSLELLESAPLPSAPVAPRPRRNAAFAFALGVLLSNSALLLRNALDRRSRSVTQLEQQTGLPVLATFPGNVRHIAKSGREALSYLHTNLDLILGQRYPAAVVVTSALAANSHSSVARHLASSFARADRRVLLVDADPSRAALSQELNPEGLRVPALQHYLQDSKALLEPLQIRAGDRYSFDFVPTLLAPAYQDDLLRQGLEGCVAAWRASYDLVLFDAPAILQLADGLILTTACDLALLCTDVKHDSSPQLMSAIKLLERTKVPLAMCAFNLPRLSQANISSPSLRNSKREDSGTKKASREAFVGPVEQ